MPATLKTSFPTTPALESLTRRGPVRSIHSYREVPRGEMSRDEWMARQKSLPAETGLRYSPDGKTYAGETQPDGFVEMDFRNVLKMPARIKDNYIDRLIVRVDLQHPEDPNKNAVLIEIIPSHKIEGQKAMDFARALEIVMDEFFKRGQPPEYTEGEQPVINRDEPYFFLQRQIGSLGIIAAFLDYMESRDFMRDLKATDYLCPDRREATPEKAFSWGDVDEYTLEPGCIPEELAL